jgi:hypothetical protein
LAEQATPQPDTFGDNLEAKAEAEVYQVLSKLMDATLGRHLHRGAAVPPLGHMSTFRYTRRYFVGRFGGTHVVGLVAFSVET